MSRVLIGLSGGVDSAAAAILLQRQGYDLAALHCVMHENDAAEKQDAERVADALGIPFFSADLRQSFREQVLSPFAAEYAAGRTPNPCILCNPAVKFKALLDRADALSCDYIATGHYAGVGEEKGRFFIRQSRMKDQSYMLSRLPQKILSRLLLPLERAEKPALRALAAEKGLPVAEKKDSQDLCFLPPDPAARAACLASLSLPAEPGDFILEETGEPCGKHGGLYRYTVGQRKNLGIALGRPVYVTRLCPETNRVFLSFEDPFAAEAALSGLCFQKYALAPGQAMRLSVKTRLAAPPVPCTLTVTGEGTGFVRFDEPARAVTPGQSAVFYEGGDLVAAGFFDAPQK